MLLIINNMNYKDYGKIENGELILFDLGELACAPESYIFEKGYKKIVRQSGEGGTYEEGGIIYVETPIIQPSVYQLFDKQAFKNALFAYCMPDTAKVKEFVGAITEFSNNGTREAFRCMNLFLYYDNKAGSTSDADYLKVKEALLTQGIDLDNLPDE